LSGIQVKDIECIETSFPNFLELLGEITEIRTWK